MSGGGGEYDLNLTPYIDLMSTLIVFLLMTVVWNQISVLSSDTASTTASNEQNQPDKPKTSLSVTIMPDRMNMVENEQITAVPNINGSIDEARMAQVLKEWKSKYPEKTDVVLNTENSVTYKQLIRAFDTIVGNEFPDVGVSTQ